MTPDEPTRPAASLAPLPRRLRERLRPIASKALLRVAPPYARYRARQAETAGALARLSADLEFVRERHSEQIARLEDLARELVLTAEALRGEIAQHERREQG